MALKTHTKTFLFYLPAMVLLTLVGWVVLGALPNMHMTSDLIAWLLELPVTTCYAMAAGGSTLVFMQVTGMNIPNDQRSELLNMALSRNKDATRILLIETGAWLASLATFSAFFFPHW
jgi:hypothetical protein